MASEITSDGKHLVVARFLTEKGFPSDGKAKRDNILVNIRSMPQMLKFLWWRIQGHSSFEPGKLYLLRKELGACADHWVMHVHKKTILCKMQCVAKMLSEEFNVDVHVRLEREEVYIPEDW